MPIASTVLALHYGVLVARALVPGALSPNPMQEIATPWHGEIEGGGAVGGRDDRGRRSSGRRAGW